MAACDYVAFHSAIDPYYMHVWMQTVIQGLYGITTAKKAGQPTGTMRLSLSRQGVDADKQRNKWDYDEWGEWNILHVL